MKTAKKFIMSVELQCPDCGTTIPSPGGSLFWEVAEIGPENAARLVCPDCHARLKFPKGL